MFLKRWVAIASFVVSSSMRCYSLRSGWLLSSSLSGFPGRCHPFHIVIILFTLSLKSDESVQKGGPKIRVPLFFPWCFQKSNYQPSHEILVIKKWLNLVFVPVGFLRWSSSSFCHWNFGRKWQQGRPKNCVPPFILCGVWRSSQILSQTVGDAPKWVTKTSTFVSSFLFFQFGGPAKLIPRPMNCFSETASITGAVMVMAGAIMVTARSSLLLVPLAIGDCFVLADNGEMSPRHPSINFLRIWRWRLYLMWNSRLKYFA